ncbi:hypothetical protein BRC83_10715 [Halobacteriales archaeon QS_1_68_17]|nr:MAG: hypothetical protein BRC83_10715 [Halobacteriales archaeon QS_1_68_17]
MARGDTLINGLVGGMVSIVLAFLPFSTVIGGAVAGYLEGDGRERGAKVGALAGLIAAVPLLGLFLLVGSFFVVVPFEIGGVAAGALGLAAITAMVLFVTLYGILLSTLGGVIGTYLREEVDLRG